MDYNYFLEKNKVEINKFALEKKVFYMYRSEGGLAFDDKLTTETEFLEKYCRCSSSAIFIRSEYQPLFVALLDYIDKGKIYTGIPFSFFFFPIARFVSRGVLECDFLVETIVEGPAFQFKDYDIFGVFGIATQLNSNLDYASYLQYVRDTYDKKKIVQFYRSHVAKYAQSVKLRDIEYSHPYEFWITAEKQFPLYYEVISKLKKKIKDLKIFVPFDGLGIVSMLCIALDIPYYSYESYEIGSIACELGIITSRVADRVCAVDEVFILGNLSNYYNVSSMIDNCLSKKYVVIDENRLFYNINVNDIKYSTHGRVTSNVLDDDFIGGGPPIATSETMLKEKKCIPLSAKAEMYLLCSRLPVYTDGFVVTYTPAQSKGDFYIDTSDTNIVIHARSPYVCSDCKKDFNNYRILSKKYIQYECSCGKVAVQQFEHNFDDYGKDLRYLNVVNRNYPNDLVSAKNGVIKRHEGDLGVVEDGEMKIFTDYEFRSVTFRMYENPRELKNYFESGGYYIGKCVNPRTVRYLYCDGRFINLMYVRFLDKGGVRYYAFRDALSKKPIEYDLT